MSMQAYQKAAERAESPRATEYRLFADVTRALMDADKADRTDLKTRMAALDWNRRMWAAFAADCASPNNRLPPPLRASIVSLSLFVSRQTSVIVRERLGLELLIDVNRTIMQGLSPTGAAPERAAA